MEEAQSKRRKLDDKHSGAKTESRMESSDKQQLNVSDLENDDLSEHSNEEECCLALSDLDDLEDFDDGETHIDASDPLVAEYLTKYPKITKLINNASDSSQLLAVNFIRLLEKHQVDPFASYDLDVEEIVEDEEYIINQCNNLDDSQRRDLWDEYCRVQGEAEITNKVSNFIEYDTPELQFVSFLKSLNEFKFPKFYTDFNRQIKRKSKVDNDQRYDHLCGCTSQNVRQQIYNKWVQFYKLPVAEKSKALAGELGKYKNKTFDQVLELIKTKKLDLWEIYFLPEDEINELKGTVFS